MVVSIGFDRIRRPYSRIGEFGAHISVGNKHGDPGFRIIAWTYSTIFLGWPEKLID